jgi:ribonuclease H / adenosylcobalamin/alpha-ribazole phosphatase
MTRPDEPGPRERQATRIIEALAPINGVRSVRLVGSYWSASAPSMHPADVDVVVILEQLTRARFEACVHAAQKLTGDVFGHANALVRVNSTFGPIKVGAPGDVVVHLMVYDATGHRAHVLDSPFTCLDWEREDRGFGLSLKDTFAVPPLAPPSLVTARRGVADYMRDLEGGSVSVRRYEWSADETPTITVDRVALDERNRGEFALHIVRHLLTNFHKVIHGRNETLADDALRAAWNELAPETRALQDDYFAALKHKRDGGSTFAARAVAVGLAFASAFGEALDGRLSSMRVARFVRHAATTVQDGTFLGQRRDPPLADPDAVLPLASELLPDSVWTSPALRARQTAARLAPPLVARDDPRLLEIDYGEAEGLDLAGLRAQFPALIEAWTRGEDPRFPGGESTADVLSRLNAVLGDLARGGGSSLVVSHNVVMRCLIGSLLGVPRNAWHRIVVPHLGMCDAYFLGHGTVLHLDRAWLGAVLDLRTAA